MRPLVTGLLLGVLVLVSSFRADSRFEKNGISFQVPDGWVITEEEVLEGNNYYLSLERSGEDQSGLVTMTFFEGKMDVHASVEMFQASLQDQFKEMEVPVQFSAIRAGSFHGFTGAKATFSLSINDPESGKALKHFGTIYSVVSCGKTVCIIIQEAEEDMESNQAGLRKIEESFSCSVK